MGHIENHNKITYIEFATRDVARAKDFYSRVFGWSFADWGPDYASFSGAGVSGGFAQSHCAGDGPVSGPLVVLYATDLKAAQEAVTAAGGQIVKPSFPFPGGRRFHFSDGLGNVLAVWSEVDF